MATDANNPAAGTPGSTPEQAAAGLVSPTQTEDHDREIVPGEGDTGEGEGQQAKTEPVVDDTEEIEHEGQKYRVPKAVKPLLMMRADHTRKTQELAERGRAIETERETLNKSIEAERAILKESNEVAGLDWGIAQLKAIDFAALQQSDPARAQKLFWDLQQLQGQRDERFRELQQKISQRDSEAERKRESERVNRIEQSRAILARDVEGWSDDTANKAFSYLVSPAIGFTPDELRQGFGDKFDHRIIVLAHLAREGAEAKAKLKAAAQQPRPASNPQPTAKVGGAGAPATKSPDKMTTEEWMAHRNSQLRKRKG